MTRGSEALTLPLNQEADPVQLPPQADDLLGRQAPPEPLGRTVGPGAEAHSFPIHLQVQVQEEVNVSDTE